jgi:hypothetical protein
MRFRGQAGGLRGFPAAGQAMRPGSGSLCQTPARGSAGPQPGDAGAAGVTCAFQPAAEQGEQR